MFFGVFFYGFSAQHLSLFPTQPQSYTKHPHKLSKYFQKVAGKDQEKSFVLKDGLIDEQHFKSGLSCGCRARSPNKSEGTNRTDGWSPATPTETGASPTNAEAAGGGRRKGGVMGDQSV